MSGLRAERAEVTPSVETTKGGYLPRWARVPASILAVLGLGAIDQITSLIPTSEAADPQCTVGVRIESYQFFDMAQIVPELGKRHIIDWGVDPRAGAAAGYVVDAAPLSYKKGDRNKPDYKPFASDNIVRDIPNDVGRGTMSFTTTCNDRAETAAGENRPAVRFKLVSSLDPDNDQFEVVVPNGVRKVVAFGAEVRKAQDFKAIVDSGLKQIKDMDDKKKGLINQAAQGNPTPANPNPNPGNSGTTTQPGTAGSGAQETGGLPVVPVAVGGTGLLAFIYRFLPWVPHFVKGGHKII